MKLPGLLVATLSSAGCAGLMSSHVNAYPGSDRRLGEVAVLRSAGAPMIARIDDRSLGLGYPPEVRVLPGEHRVRVDCKEANYRISPTEITGRFEAGHFYQLTCHHQGDGRYAVDIRDLGTEDPARRK